MSTTKRLISGTSASWARIGGTMLTQIILVPIFLNHWDVKVYGIWIAVQALVNVLGTLDRGYVDYLGYEFLKTGTENKEKIGRDLWSGFGLVISVALIESLIVAFLAFSKFLPITLGESSSSDKYLIWQTGWVLILQWMGWAFCANTTGLFFRALAPFGYYPRMAWWDFIISILTSIISVIIVILGGNLLVTGIGTTVFLFIITIIRFFDIKRLLKKETIPHASFSAILGLKNYYASILLSFRYFLENFRQQGIRLILAPMLGVTGLAKFSTIRTVSNVMQQGLMTVTNPLLPELMRFLKQRDQSKTETAFASVWLILVVALAPGTVLLQLFSQKVFSVWTNGQIEFDPLLLIVLSLSVLVYALAQPAMAVIIGNNLLNVQIANSIVSSLVLVISLFALIPSLDILGAGIALLLAESTAAIGFIIAARKWLNTNDLTWPIKPFVLATFSIFLSGFCMIYIYFFPSMTLLCILIAFTGFAFIVKAYWEVIPIIVKEKIYYYLGYYKFRKTNL